MIKTERKMALENVTFVDGVATATRFYSDIVWTETGVNVNFTIYFPERVEIFKERKFNCLHDAKMCLIGKIEDSLGDKLTKELVQVLQVHNEVFIETKVGDTIKEIVEGLFSSNFNAGYDWGIPCVFCEKEVVIQVDTIAEATKLAEIMNEHKCNPNDYKEALKMYQLVIA